MASSEIARRRLTGLGTVRTREDEFYYEIEHEGAEMVGGAEWERGRKTRDKLVKKMMPFESFGSWDALSKVATQLPNPVDFERKKIVSSLKCIPALLLMSNGVSAGKKGKSSAP